MNIRIMLTALVLMVVLLLSGCAGYVGYGNYGRPYGDDYYRGSHEGYEHGGGGHESHGGR